jgi:TonB family protein
VLRFPEPYRRRAIEGWAVVTYDVAPWGEINNIQVKASQPSADFGAQAVTVLRSARVKPGPGAVGCVERVRFVMESDQAETAP